MTFQEFCDILAKTETSSIIEDVYIFNKEVPKILEKTINVLFILKCVILFLISVNGVILYRTLELFYPIMPHIPSIIIGITFYIFLMSLQDFISDDNLLSEIIESVVSIVSMIVVLVYYM